MKLLTIALLAATVAQAHYTFPRIAVNGKAEDKDWSATRRTRNAEGKQGLSSPTVADIRCYSSQTAPNVVEVPAGATVHWVTSQQMNHPGPTQYYLAKVPDGSSATKWDGSGSVWFKFHTTTATIDAAKQMTWPNQNQYTTVNATVPKATPSGEYLIRVEQIALHQPNQPQIYLACTQIKITGGGSGTPGPLVALPGAYKANDPAVFLNLASVGSGTYVGPGPPVWSG